MRAEIHNDAAARKISTVVSRYYLVVFMLWVLDSCPLCSVAVVPLRNASSWPPFTAASVRTGADAHDADDAAAVSALVVAALAVAETLCYDHCSYCCCCCRRYKATPPTCAHKQAEVG